MFISLNFVADLSGGLSGGGGLSLEGSLGGGGGGGELKVEASGKETIPFLSREFITYLIPFFLGSGGSGGGSLSISGSGSG